MVPALPRIVWTTTILLGDWWGLKSLVWCSVSLRNLGGWCTQSAGAPLRPWDAVLLVLLSISADCVDNNTMRDGVVGHRLYCWGCGWWAVGWCGGAFCMRSSCVCYSDTLTIKIFIFIVLPTKVVIIVSITRV